MRRFMVRLDDDLYRSLNNAAHDNRQSMNAFIVEAIRKRTRPAIDGNYIHPAGPTTGIYIP